MENAIENKAVQLAYVNILFKAVNASCRQMHGITYTSSDRDDERVLSPFETFLCKLAQICDTKKGGDTIASMVALKGDNGPKYLFVQNNRKEMELESTKDFLTGILTFVSTNPEGLDVKPLQKAVLWRILEHNFPRVKLYLNKVKDWVEECIGRCDAEADSITFQALRGIQTRSHFPREIAAGDNSKNKFLKDCETLIKAIHSTKTTGASDGINQFARATEAATSHAWCELRHYLGRLHSYRLASEAIVKASAQWPGLFRGFTVEYIPSSRALKLPLRQPAPSMMEVIRIAFPDMDLNEYLEEITELGDYHGLRDHLQDELRHRSLRQFVHCEVQLRDFLIGAKKTSPAQYWNNSMFIATSKPPCRLCHYFFDDVDNGFEVQSSHMNVYPGWRLPSIGDQQGGDAGEQQNEVLDDIIEQMQQDTLRIVRERFPQGNRNDSRTESRGLTTAMSYDGGESNVRDVSHGATMTGRVSALNDPNIEFVQSRLDGDFYFVDQHGVGAAV